jgi:hypothetical protein
VVRIVIRTVSARPGKRKARDMRGSRSRPACVNRFAFSAKRSTFGA